MSSSSRSSSVRWCRRSCSTSACIACSSRGELIEPEYIVFSTSLTLAVTADALVLEPLDLADDLVAAAARVGELRVERGDHGLGPVSAPRSGRVARRCRRWSAAVSCSWTTRSCSSGRHRARAYRPAPRVTASTTADRWATSAAATVGGGDVGVELGGGNPKNGAGRVVGVLDGGSRRRCWPGRAAPVLAHDATDRPQVLVGRDEVSIGLPDRASTS